MPKVHEGNLNADGRRFAIAVSRFNGLVTSKLLEAPSIAYDVMGAPRTILRSPGSPVRSSCRWRRRRRLAPGVSMSSFV